MFQIPAFQHPTIDLDTVLIALKADFPKEVWFVPSLVLMVLALTALIDARTGRVPLIPLLVALAGSFLAFAFFAGWIAAAERAYPVLILVAVLWLFNKACINLIGHDAFGMGDVKWSAVAGFTFGIWPVFWSWVIGAWFALVWLFLRKVSSKVLDILGSDYYQGHAYVHFVPFLLLGLCSILLFGLQAP